jgi:hypothetical protein
MSIVAVITGDIVHSSKMSRKQREQLLGQLEAMFVDLDQCIEAAEIFRGDSFQVLLRQPEKALRAAVLFRAGLRKIPHQQEDQRQYTDARIAIGVGELSYRADSLGMSDGEAFRLSGRGLDEMNYRERLIINTLWDDFNEEMEVSCALSEAIIGRWTHAQAAIIYSYLLSGKTQQALAKEFGITQGAVSQRLSESGNIGAIRKLLQRYEKLINKHLSQA